MHQTKTPIATAHRGTLNEFALTTFHSRLTPYPLFRIPRSPSKEIVRTSFWAQLGRGGNGHSSRVRPSVCFRGQADELIEIATCCKQPVDTCHRPVKNSSAGKHLPFPRILQAPRRSQ